jgi:DNA-binding response OmpR family regulator
MKVLLVDDEDDFRELLGKRLTKRGLAVSTAASGEAGLGQAQDGDFDVVVLDVKMPGMDGLEVLRRLRKIAPDTEVILLTGHANMEVAVEGMDLGAFDYLMKPVAINELLYKIQDATARRRLRLGRQG